MMITRCPECATAFRISHEQLEARVGQVRCGRCGEIFDASATLEVNDDLDAQLQPASPEEEKGEGVPEPELAPEEPIDHSLTESNGTVSDPAITAAEADASAMEEMPVTEASAEESTVLAGEEPDAAIAEASAGERAEDEPISAIVEPAVESAEDEPVAPAATADPVAAFAPWQPDAGSVSPTWAPQAQTASATPYASRAGSHASPFAGGRVRKRPATGWWLFFSLLLLLTLLAQAAFHYRGTLALLLPESKPYIYTLCAELGCDVPLPRDVNRLIIETYEVRLHQSQPSYMVLSATLRNLAPFPQEFPAIEFTLTDEANQPLARRVITAREYLRRQPEAFPASSEYEVLVHFQTEVPTSKYRLLLFYP